MEAVNHPDHYCQGRKYEPKDVIRDWGLNFNLGSAVKYIARAGRKDNVIEDLEKARKYLEYEIEAIKEEHNETSGSSDGGDAPEGKLPEISVRFETFGETMSRNYKEFQERRRDLQRDVRDGMREITEGLK